MARKKKFLLDYKEEVKDVLGSNDIEEVRAMLEYIVIHTNERIEYLLNNACDNMNITYEQLKNKDYKVTDSYTQELLNEAYTLMNIIDKTIASVEKEQGNINKTNISNVLNQDKKDTTKN